MKHVFYFFAMSTLLILAVGCGNDDDGPSCTQEQFLGVYTGADECTGTSPSVASGEYTITAGNSANTLVITDEFGLSNDATINGCGFSWGNTVLGSGQEGSGTLDGDALTLRRTTQVLNSTVSDCEFSGTK